ncbi:prolipoprotein diacylglyceryl transferase [Deinococcus maricopensis]|uniref:Phosphatidylglycerol--prolipoprotein diacylglyceryl transferase n=1 Tax=Deinococcus maricopensis (strain DSM 21211 / LMG 22137 / NRRL B-23946 / LB-34) TaxID=709986 RepID=E8U700_DEIML|nr:prolipoprotein diacylglyceryl transferase [Deinococcus maricopensis]ADV66839.1 Prolipoprotein diacylglyceryl transferase [Deinococcus maricopensis DSM 21211]
MDPVAFQIGSFTVAWYGILITAGILLGSFVGTRLARQRGLNADLLQDMILWAVVWGVIGARIVFVATSWHLFAGKSGVPLLVDIINIRQGGISIHGGLIAGILVLIYYTRRYRLNFYQYADLFVPGVAFGIIGGRIGNIMNGSDTVGRVTGWPVGYVWPDSARAFHDAMCNPQTALNLAQYCVNKGGQMVMTAPVHFTQMYGVIIGIMLSVAAFFWLRSRIPGWTFWQFWLWYSLLRAGWEETFRLNPLPLKSYLSEGLDKPGIGLWTETQLISIPLILVSIYFLITLRRKARTAPADSGPTDQLAAQQ